MSNSIEINWQGVERPERASPAAKSGEGSFVGALGDAVKQADQLQVAADQQSSQLANGGGNLHETALALEKADVAMRLMTKVRNKLVDAYQEVMRMNV